MTLSPISHFLHFTRDAVLRESSKVPFRIVLGNTSADLDSFVSAVVFAYFHAAASATIPGNRDTRVFVPLLNLTDVPSSELWRLRPEYGTALRLAMHGPSDDVDQRHQQDVEKELLKDITTIADVLNNPSSPLHSTFAQGSDHSKVRIAGSEPEVVLVDHNAPQVSGLSSDELRSRFSVKGVIDHHVDESYPTGKEPRIIRTGIGSCTSLVVQHLRDENLWPQETERNELSQFAKLALAPILVDTFNLKATGDKISDTDRQAVKFLESKITPTNPDWDRTAFYDAVQDSKSNSLNLLTMNEIFERDYKEWDEQPSSGSQPLNIGVASLVRDIPWLVEHAGSSEKMAEAIHSFARKTDHNLSILALITKGNGPNGEFRKGLAVVAYGDAGIKALKRFENDAGELQLTEREETEDFSKALADIAQSENENTAHRVWWQGDVSKSRKQIAPLLREAVKKA